MVPCCNTTYGVNTEFNLLPPSLCEWPWNQKPLFPKVKDNYNLGEVSVRQYI